MKYKTQAKNVYGDFEDIWLPAKRFPKLRRVLRRLFEAALIVFLYLLIQFVVSLLKV